MDLQISGEYLNTAIKASKSGGRIAELMKETASVGWKSNDTIVTEADREVETRITEILSEEFDFPVLGEEHSDIEKIDETGTYWVVDPIDGTKNYANHQPLYGSTVAFVQEGEPIIGSFYMPELDYLFYARQGEGAYRNGEQIHVSDVVALDDAYIVGTGYGSSAAHSEMADSLTRWIQRFSCGLMAGSWVASGWNDAMISGAMAPWDLASTTVFVREAGGVVQTLTGQYTEWAEISRGNLVMASTGSLAEEIITALPDKVIEDLEAVEYF